MGLVGASPEERGCSGIEGMIEGIERDPLMILLQEVDQASLVEFRDEARDATRVAPCRSTPHQNCGERKYIHLKD